MLSDTLIAQDKPEDQVFSKKGLMKCWLIVALQHIEHTKHFCGCIKRVGHCFVASGRGLGPISPGIWNTYCYLCRGVWLEKWKRKDSTWLGNGIRDSQRGE